MNNPRPLAAHEIVTEAVRVIHEWNWTLAPGHEGFSGDIEKRQSHRQGARGVFTSNSIGLSHYFNDVFVVRPEIGYYRNWTNPNFDNGTKHGIWLYGFDMTLRF